MKTSLTWAVLLFCCLPAAGQDAAARRIQQRYEAAVPSDKALSFYSLDWAANLAEAKKRAAQERRPILHIGVTNITAGCNFYAGHTWANADHVRGSSLVWPAVLDTLRPFIVSSSTGRTTEDLSAELQSLYRDAGFRDTHINFALFVLDADGKLLRAVQPNVRPPAHRFDPESQGRDFKRQLDQLLDGLPLPQTSPPTKTKLTLPDVEDGLRIYLTFGKNNINHYRTPTVEAVALTDEMKQALHYPDKARDITAQELLPMLEQMYPPAIMDGTGGFRSITGTLKMKPAGKDDKHRYALAEGKINFVMDNRNRTSYTCTVSLVLKYPNDAPEKVIMRGVAEGAVPKSNPQGQVVERVKMSAAIESRPE